MRSFKPKVTKELRSDVRDIAKSLFYGDYELVVLKQEDIEKAVLGRFRELLDLTTFYAEPGRLLWAREFHGKETAQVMASTIDDALHLDVKQFEVRQSDVTSPETLGTLMTNRHHRWLYLISHDERFNERLDQFSERLTEAVQARGVAVSAHLKSDIKDVCDALRRGKRHLGGLADASVTEAIFRTGQELEKRYLFAPITDRVADFLDERTLSRLLEFYQVVRSDVHSHRESELSARALHWLGSAATPEAALRRAQALSLFPVVPYLDSDLELDTVIDEGRPLIAHMCERFGLSKAVAKLVLSHDEPFRKYAEEISQELRSGAPRLGQIQAKYVPLSEIRHHPSVVWHFLEECDNITALLRGVVPDEQRIDACLTSMIDNGSTYFTDRRQHGRIGTHHRDFINMLFRHVLLPAAMYAGDNATDDARATATEMLLSMLSRSNIVRLSEASARWHRYSNNITQLVADASHADAAWPALAPAWQHDSNGKTLEFRFLNTSLELLREGKTMRHCVADYYEQCQISPCHIASITIDGSPVATVQLNITTVGNVHELRIVQLMGPENQEVDPAITHVAEQVWLPQLSEQLGQAGMAFSLEQCRERQTELTIKRSTMTSADRLADEVGFDHSAAEFWAEIYAEYRDILGGFLPWKTASAAVEAARETSEVRRTLIAATPGSGSGGPRVALQ